MTAPDLDTLYMVEDQVEVAAAKVLQAEGFTASIQRDDELNTTPRVNIQLALGPALNQIKLIDGKAYQAAWQGTLGFEVVTKRSKDKTNEHGKMLAKLRLFMQYGEKKFTEDILPYHVLTSIKENGTTPQVESLDGTDISQVSFAVVISIRNNAWPS